MDTDVRIIGAPMDLGADRRGVDMGPSAIRYAGLADELETMGTDCADWGDVHVPRPEETDPDATRPKTGEAKFLAETEDVCTRLAHEVAEAVDAGELPLVLGGDHSIAIGTAGGVSREESTGIIWFDAHGDFNTPATTPSGNVHGMSLAAILGLGEFADMDWALAPNIDEANVVLIGLRSVDERERENIRESDVTAYTMTDVDDRGVTDVVTEAIDIATDGTDGVHVSLDLDWLDPTEAPGVGTPERGGVSYREAHASMELIAKRLAGPGLLRSFELVEVNPILDQHNQTAELAVELTASAFGKIIL
jgi:arginase